MDKAEFDQIINNLVHDYCETCCGVQVPFYSSGPLLAIEAEGQDIRKVASESMLLAVESGHHANWETFVDICEELSEFTEVKLKGKKYLVWMNVPFMEDEE